MELPPGMVLRPGPPCERRLVSASADHREVYFPTRSESVLPTAARATFGRQAHSPEVVGTGHADESVLAARAWACVADVSSWSRVGHARHLCRPFFESPRFGGISRAMRLPVSPHRPGLRREQDDVWRSARRPAVLSERGGERFGGTLQALLDVAESSRHAAASKSFRGLAVHCNVS
jgi:hypothetical protein